MGGVQRRVTQHRLQLLCPLPACPQHNHPVSGVCDECVCVFRAAMCVCVCASLMSVFLLHVLVFMVDVAAILMLTLAVPLTL